MECPENSHYDLCGTECGHTCASSIDASCDRTCAEGCFCDDGFVRSGGRCVPVEQCGCLHDGFYFEVISKWPKVKVKLYICSHFKEHIQYNIMSSSKYFSCQCCSLVLSDRGTVLDTSLLSALWVFCPKWPPLHPVLLPPNSGVLCQRWPPGLLWSTVNLHSLGRPSLHHLRWGCGSLSGRIESKKI